MNRRLLVPFVVAGVAVASGVASANPQYWRANGLLLEVSADPRDGRDLVRVDPTRADSLELIALNDTVTLRGMTLHFADGRVMSQRMRLLHPGQRVLVDLPPTRAPIVTVELDYGDPAYRRYDRTPARLQIIPRMTRGDHGYGYGYGYGYRPQPGLAQGYTRHDQRWTHGRYQHVTPSYQAPAQHGYYQSSPRYRVQPAPAPRPAPVVVPPRQTPGWSGYIEGNFRF
jgi:hypothetical protein